jgi:hypothetical protein
MTTLVTWATTSGFVLLLSLSLFSTTRELFIHLDSGYLRFLERFHANCGYGIHEQSIQTVSQSSCCIQLLGILFIAVFLLPSSSIAVVVTFIILNVGLLICAMIGATTAESSHWFVWLRVFCDATCDR